MLVVRTLVRHSQMITQTSSTCTRADRRPGFHLLEQRRQLGDPRGGDQDRYALLEALMSARCHLLISWCGRHEHTGEPRPAAAPVEQWLADLSGQLGEEGSRGLCIEPPPNPLDRRNFLAVDDATPLSCDRRQLQALEWIEHNPPSRVLGLALPLSWAAPQLTEEEPLLSNDSLMQWLANPQAEWLRQLGLYTSERIDAVEDLEALKLDGLQQYTLLDQHLEENLLSGDSPDWCRSLMGQGVLPAAAGAAADALGSPYAVVAVFLAFNTAVLPLAWTTRTDPEY